LFFHEFFFLQCHNLFHRLYILFCGLLRFYILVSVLFLGNDFFLLLQLFEEIWWQWFLFCLFNLFFNMLWFYYFYCLFLLDLVFLTSHVFILFLSSLFVRWWFFFYYYFYLLWQSFYFINSLLLFFNFNLLLRDIFNGLKFFFRLYFFLFNFNFLFFCFFLIFFLFLINWFSLIF
jgi:hypothetical protein